MSREIRDLECKARGGGLMRGGTTRNANRITMAANMRGFAGAVGATLGHRGTAKGNRRLARLQKLSHYMEGRAGGSFSFGKPGDWRRGERNTSRHNAYR